MSIKNQSERIAVFCEKYPQVGPIVWMASIQFFIVEWIVAHSWKTPGYSYSANVISDLGATICGEYAGRAICSSHPALMNGSLLFLGVMTLLGSIFIFQEFRESRASMAGFTLMALSGVGTFLVGLVPENVIPVLHLVGAFLAFGFGHLALIVLSFALTRVPLTLRIYTFLSGLLGLTFLTLFSLEIYLGLGIGTIERLVSYPLTIWLVLFGFYISGSHFRKRKLEKYQSKSKD